MDTNKVWLTGLVASTPVLTKMGSRAPFASFNLLVQERYRDRAGATRIHPNIVPIEAYGRTADQVMSRVVEGQRVGVEGYMRQDEREVGSFVRVRIFAVYEEESASTEAYHQGLKQAIAVLAKHTSLDAAQKELRTLIRAGAEDPCSLFIPTTSPTAPR